MSKLLNKAKSMKPITKNATLTVASHFDADGNLVPRSDEVLEVLPFEVEPAYAGALFRMSKEHPKKWITLEISGSVPVYAEEFDKGQRWISAKVGARMKLELKKLDENMKK